MNRQQREAKSYDPAKLLADETRGKISRRARPLRSVRRPLRAGDPDRRVRTARSRHEAASARAGLPGRAGPRADELGGPSDRAHACAQAIARLGRGGVAQARGPRAHRRAQDQQRARPGVAREAARRRARGRGDRRRPARRGQRRRLCARRLAVHGVHGRGRHGAPGAECRSHEVAGRDGRAGDQRRQTLRAAIDEAFRDWVGDPNDTFYIIGSAVGPHPYPYLVRELQTVIGREARAQMLAQPVACPTR